MGGPTSRNPRRGLGAAGALLAVGALGGCGSDQGASAGARPEKAVRDYVAALDARDGAAVCRAFAPGAVEAVRLPKRGGSCTSSVDASLGYRDPRGYPVWRRTRILDFRSIDTGPDTARATVTVKTTFAGDREPSIEDDVIYLRNDGGHWRVAKASTTFYRAIGAAGPPLEALRPPPGWPG